MALLDGPQKFEKRIRIVDSLNSAVNMGMVPGYQPIDKFGENPDIDLGSVPEDIWEYGGEYIYDADATAPIQYVSSSSALDAGLTISITGLDIDGNEVTQEITCNGQTNVTLTTPLWRVYRMQNESASGNDLVGLVFCHTDPAPVAGVPTGTAVRALIDNGNNQTLMALYTVPAGKVGFLCRGEIGMSRSQTAGAIQAAYYSRRYGKVFKIKKRVDIVNSGSSIYQDERCFPDVIPALTDIKLTIENVSANNAGAFGTFDILLVDEIEFKDSYLVAIGQPGY